MFVLVVRFRAKRGQEKTIERMIHDMTAKVRREEKETLLYDFHRKVGDASEFLLYERYTDRKAWEVTHCEKPAFKKLLADLPSYVDGEIDKTEYELIEAK
jgi:quinol monooxygenase YgiN